MAAITVTDYDTDYITVEVSGMSTIAKHIEFYIDGNLDKYYALSGTSKSHTYTGLSPGTSYTMYAVVYDVDWNQLPFAANSVTQKTASRAIITVNYYDGSESWTSYGPSPLTVDGPDKTDWTFLGWATSTSTTSIVYEEGDLIRATSDKTLNLYAVYKKESTIYCYYIDGSSGSLYSNTRPKIQYRVNTSKSSYSTNYYNNITLPSFDSANSTITTSEPVRSWSAIGWHPNSFATEPDYSPGQTVASNLISSDLYAMYSNECSITYNANGGSGSMSKQTGTGYYNAFGNYSGVTFSISSCSFTPPSGKRFDSWNVKSDGSGTEYSSGETVTTSYEVIFYAIWVTGRPSDWSWTTTGISKGSSMAYTQSGTTITPKPLTATEWLAFMNRVKEFYKYLGKTVDSTYWNRAVNGVSSGSVMTATQVNSARYLINQLSPPTSVPSAVSSGSTITAAFINGLKNSLNSIK